MTLDEIDLKRNNEPVTAIFLQVAGETLEAATSRLIELLNANHFGVIGVDVSGDLKDAVFRSVNSHASMVPFRVTEPQRQPAQVLLCQRTMSSAPLQLAVLPVASPIPSATGTEAIPLKSNDQPESEATPEAPTQP